MESRGFAVTQCESVAEGLAALLCAAAIQDRLWDYNRRVEPDRRIEVRIAVTLGEVTLVIGPGEIAKEPALSDDEIDRRIDGALALGRRPKDIADEMGVSQAEAVARLSPQLPSPAAPRADGSATTT